MPALALLISLSVFGQSPLPAPALTQVQPPDSTEPGPKANDIQPDRSDPVVVHAQQNVDRIRGLVQQGVLPANDFLKAQDDLNDALDNSILRYGAFNQNLLPEQADQMVVVAQRMFMRRQQRSIQVRALAVSGVLSRAEAETATDDTLSAKLQLDLAIERANLVKEMALQRTLVEAENEAESHPEWNGKLYTRYDGNGVFTRAEFDKISAAYLVEFGHAIPVSADGQTAVHKSMGFNHAGRIDIALNPEQREGAWLMRYLEKNHIPYYAFKAAIAHKATGAHIHLGPGSTKLTATSKSACCGS